MAGPDLQEGKPAGTVYVGVCRRSAGQRDVLVQLEGGERNAIREAAVDAALSLLLSTLAEN